LSLNVLFRGIRRHIEKFFIKKFLFVQFFCKFVLQNLVLDLDPAPDWSRIKQQPGSGSVITESGSKTMLGCQPLAQKYIVQSYIRTLWPGVPVRQPYAGVDFIPQ
jgi:hypothetical protein